MAPRKERDLFAVVPSRAAEIVSAEQIPWQPLAPQQRELRELRQAAAIELERAVLQRDIAQGAARQAAGLGVEITRIQADASVEITSIRREKRDPEAQLLVDAFSHEMAKRMAQVQMGIFEVGAMQLGKLAATLITIPEPPKPAPPPAPKRRVTLSDWWQGRLINEEI